MRKLIGLVGLAHAISHFSQLVLPPLFPWIKDAFALSYTELGAVLTVFFVVSCVVQAASGFLVDKLGPRPVLFAGLAPAGLSAFGYALAHSYWMLFGGRRAGGHRQRRVPPGRLHPVQPQGDAHRAWAMPTACTASPAAWAGRWRRPSWCRWPSPSPGASALAAAGVRGAGGAARAVGSTAACSNST